MNYGPGFYFQSIWEASLFYVHQISAAYDMINGHPSLCTLDIKLVFGWLCECIKLGQWQNYCVRLLLLYVEFGGQVGENTEVELIVQGPILWWCLPQNNALMVPCKACDSIGHMRRILR